MEAPRHPTCQMVAGRFLFLIMSIIRGSQLWWSQDFLATCLLANIHIITIMAIEIKYDDDDDDDDADAFSLATKHM